MTIDTAKSIGELAAELPGAFRIFEKVGIDYCCGGQQTLAEACAAAGVPLEDVLRSLEAEPASTPAADWRTRPLEDLVAHLVEIHHSFTRESLSRIELLLGRVCAVHGGRHPELHRVRAAFESLRDDLVPHLAKEERVLFPYVLALAEATRDGALPPMPPFRTVQNPIRMMNVEHEAVGVVLRVLREASGGYTAPADGCPSYRALYEALADLEADLHLHIHLETNVLFPRAIELEERG
ncbi:MAG: iron-sulfur cluster repair di-iron protein [Deltaproteobacteria bacterium]|nr:iron-sulfur cluster repair di-iron protein [Deltaproteobacteria bacterium]